MWYVAHLLFAQESKQGRRRVKCESCDVLFRVSSARKCYDRALTWAKRHAKYGTFRFVGVRHITSLDDEQPTDGSEIGGIFFDLYDVWQKVDSLIPKKEEIPAIFWEDHPKTPIRELMSPKQKGDFCEILQSEKEKSR